MKKNTKGISIRKIIGLSFLLYILYGTVLVLGLNVNFITNQNIFESKWQMYLSFLFGFLLFLSTVRENGFYNNHFKGKSKQKFLFAFLSLWFIPFLFVILIESSLFYPLHQIMPQKEVKQNVLIYSKSKKESKSEYCLKTEYKNTFSDFTICVSKQIYNKVNVGEYVSIIGNKSLFGIKVNKISKSSF